MFLFRPCRMRKFRPIENSKILARHGRRAAFSLASCLQIDSNDTSSRSREARTGRTRVTHPTGRRRDDCLKFGNEQENGFCSRTEQRQSQALMTRQPNSAASARRDAVSPDVTYAASNDRWHHAESTTHATGGARHCRGRQNPSRGSGHWGVSMTPVCSTILGSSIRTTRTRGAEIA